MKNIVTGQLLSNTILTLTLNCQTRGSISQPFFPEFGVVLLQYYRTCDLLLLFIITRRQ